MLLKQQFNPHLTNFISIFIIRSSDKNFNILTTNKENLTAAEELKPELSKPLEPQMYPMIPCKC